MNHIAKQEILLYFPCHIFPTDCSWKYRPRESHVWHALIPGTSVYVAYLSWIKKVFVSLRPNSGPHGGSHGLHEYPREAWAATEGWERVLGLDHLLKIVQAHHGIFCTIPECKAKDSKMDDPSSKIWNLGMVTDPKELQYSFDNSSFSDFYLVCPYLFEIWALWILVQRWWWCVAQRHMSLCVTICIVCNVVKDLVKGNIWESILVPPQNEPPHVYIFEQGTKMFIHNERSSGNIDLVRPFHVHML